MPALGWLPSCATSQRLALRWRRVCLILGAKCTILHLIQPWQLGTFPFGMPVPSTEHPTRWLHALPCAPTPMAYLQVMAAQYEVPPWLAHDAVALLAAMLNPDPAARCLGAEMAVSRVGKQAQRCAAGAALAY